MICHKTRCRQAQVCRKCGETDPSIDKCENNSKCPSCDDDHIAGSRECEAEQKERKIKEVQTKGKSREKNSYPNTIRIRLNTSEQINKVSNPLYL